MAMKLFGTDGIRGEANIWPISVDGATRTGQALAQLLKKNQTGEIHVLIGKDTRESGTMLEQALTASLISEGIHVHCLGVAPTPAVAYLTAKHQFIAGIMLTASHNPFQDNGIKIFAENGYKLSASDEEFLESVILADRDATKQIADSSNPIILGSFSNAAVMVEDYSSFVKASLKPSALAGMKLVIDAANGASFEIAQSIFSDLGAEVIALNTEPNGRNINLNCGALYPEATAKVVLEQAADIGICFDGDTDRVIFIDEKGEVVPGDNVLALCAIALKKEEKLAQDTLVVTVMSNLGTRDCLAEHGIEMVATAVGDKHVVQAMREGNFSLGGENSGHIIFAENATTGDGIMSALMLLSILKKEQKPLSDLASCLTPYPSLLSAIKVKDKPALESVPEIYESMQSAENLLGDQGRILVRYSGTEKKIRVLVEAKDADLAQQCSKTICTAIHNTIAL
ncbi:phosphoglucosamine mutase [Akkermansiaceae bacterium]|nr:phosphoglucosamine mutase [Akkermansiaceae bacterium]